MSSRKAKKDDQEEWKRMRNGPVEDSPATPPAAGALPPHQQKEAYTMSMNEMESKIRELRSLQRLIEEL